MAKCVVFKILKESKSANDPKAPLLNGKHFIYIATRPGTIHNKDCGFGLFGQLPYMGEADDINNLDKAKAIITSVSSRRKIFRSVLSVDDETGNTKALYDRANWQDLVMKNINVIAKEMDIDRKDFCWTASMHYKKGHPHVHVLFWDNSGKVRNDDYIPKERFKIATEHIRAKFSYDVFKDEINERQSEKRDLEHEARLELQSLCKELNVMGAIDLDRISEAKLGDIGQRIYDLAQVCPQHGSFKYGYMPPAYKALSDALIAELMLIPDFRKLKDEFIRLTDEVSRYYGNGEKTADTNRINALKELNAGLGNEILQFIKANNLASSPTELDELKELVRENTRRLLQNSQGYVTLRNMMPIYRTPMQEILTNDFKLKKDEVVKEILSDIRLKASVQTYIKNIKDTQTVPVPPELKKAENKVLSRETYSPLFRAVDSVVMEKLYQDSGYEQQWKNDMAVNMLIQVFGNADQRLNQQRSQHQLDKLKARDKSKTALRDLQKRREQQGYWGQEW